MHILFSLGIILFGAWFAGKIIKYAGLPLVTAYIIFGILMGPDILNLVHGSFITASPLISSVGLGFIAFNIGQGFVWENIKRLGKMVIWISCLEAFMAWIFVTLGVRFLAGMSWATSICLGALASATAPAATMMVIREYKASGLFTNTLLGVVALDDAWCLVIISIAIAVSKAVSFHGAGNTVILNALFHSIGSITGACLVGALLTAMLKKISIFVVTRDNLLIFMLSFLFIGIGTSEMFHLPLLLTCMIMGGVLANITRETKFFDVLHEVDAPVYLLFFVLAGANLKIAQIGTIGIVGIVYFFVRVAGKFSGSYLGSVISDAPVRIRKYIWLGLVPQAGVALGAALMVRDRFPLVGETIFTTVVVTTVLYELVGPLCTKLSLRKAGEIL